MNLPIISGKRGQGRGAFTMVEVMVALGIGAFMFVSLYAGIAQSTSTLQSAREKLRATQILTEKLEVIRLYNWDQVNTAGFVPSAFTDYQYPGLGTNAPNKGTVYLGTITLGPANVHPKYTNTMRRVVATVKWVSGSITNQQRMETFISEYGVQKYVY
jgi:type II secretory pathway pseudopilin PulG